MEEAAVLEEKKRPDKNSGNVGRMEEAVEEENNSILRKIFLFIYHRILEECKKLGKTIHKTWQKLWKCWKNGKSCGRRK